ncbi:hypothetical protein MBANPS3_005217 [Mucor bainieri]
MVSSFLSEQETINADIEHRFAKYDSLLVQIADALHLLMSSDAFKNLSQPPTPGTSLASTNICPTSTDAASKPTVTPTWADIASRPAAPLSDRNRQALHRIFSPIATDSSAANSYTFVYLPISHRMTRTQIRSKFRALSIDNLRVLDIIFPARNTIGILLHEVFISEFCSKLLEIDTSPISSFNPLDPNHIADPKYHDLPHEDRTRLARTLHQDRCLRTLSFIRPNLLPGIAKYFIRQGWIPDHLAQDIINKRIPRPVQRRRIPSSSEATDLHQTSLPADTHPNVPSSGPSQPSTSPLSSQTQEMDITPDFVSPSPNSPPDRSRSTASVPSPRKLRKSPRLKGSTS